MNGLTRNFDLTNSLVSVFSRSLLIFLVGDSFKGVELETPVTPLEALLDITTDLL